MKINQNGCDKPESSLPSFYFGIESNKGQPLATKFNRPYSWASEFTEGKRSIAETPRWGEPFLMGIKKGIDASTVALTVSYRLFLFLFCICKCLSDVKWRVFLVSGSMRLDFYMQYLQQMASDIFQLPHSDTGYLIEYHPDLSLLQIVIIATIDYRSNWYLSLIKLCFACRVVPWLASWRQN